MSFDYIGAKKAGFTDEQISQHTGFDIAGARKANFTDEQISQHLANKTSNNQPQQSGLEKLGNFLAPSLTQTIKKGLKGELKTQQKKSLGESIKQSFYGSNPLIGMIANQDYRREIAAPGLEVASYLIPAGKVGKGAKASQKILSTAKAGAKAGALMGTSEAMRKNQNLSEGLRTVAKTTGTGAIVGAATQGLIEAGTGVFNKLTLALRNPKDKAAKIISQTFKGNKTAERAIKRQGGDKVLVKKISKLKSLPKSLNAAKKQLDDFKPDFNKKVTGVLKRSEKANKVTINPQKMLKEIKEELAQELNNPETRGQWKQAVSYLDDASKTYSKKMSAKSANNLRQRLDKQVGKKLLSETEGTEEAVKMFSRKLSNAVKKNVPETKQYFSKYSLLSDLIDIYKKEPAFGLTDLTALISGSIPGLAAAGPTGIAGGLATMGTSRAVRSPSMQRKLGSLIYKLPQITEKTSPQIRPGVFNALIRARENNK